MDDLVTWLRAQLDDDERVARMLHRSTCGHNAVTRGSGCHCDWSVWRVLAEVDAKRRILDVYKADVIDASKAGGPPEWVHGAVPVEAHTVLRLLALPYADRPGYRDEWKPEG